jgi:hypothetical protein
MKTHLVLLAFLFGPGSLSVFADSEASSPFVGNTAEKTEVKWPPVQPDLAATKMIQVQVEFIGLSHKALTKLLFLAQPKTPLARPFASSCRKW